MVYHFSAREVNICKMQCSEYKTFRKYHALNTMIYDDKCARTVRNQESEFSYIYTCKCESTGLTEDIFVLISECMCEFLIFHIHVHFT